MCSKDTLPASQIKSLTSCDARFSQHSFVSKSILLLLDTGKSDDTNIIKEEKQHKRRKTTATTFLIVAMEMTHVALPVGVGQEDTTVSHVSRVGLLVEGKGTASSNMIISNENVIRKCL